MENLSNAITEEKNAAIKAAENEAKFSAQSLLEEITPLIRDYFIADAEFDGNTIDISFLNGQKFRLCAEEVSGV